MMRNVVKLSPVMRGCFYRHLPYPSCLLRQSLMISFGSFGLVPSNRFSFAKLSKRDQEKAEKKKEKETVLQSVGGSLQTFDLSKYEDSYTTIINRMKEEFIKLRAGRLDATFFTHIYAKVGTENLPVSQLAQINVKNANTCIVSPFASENIDAIEKGLKVSETGFDITRADKSLTVSQNGSTAKELKEKLIVKTRKITQDRKEDLKVQRSKSQQQLKKYKKFIPQDRYKAIEKELKALFDKNTEQIEKISKEKEKELLK